MSRKLIQTWLAEKIGICVDQKNLGPTLQDGRIIALLLQTYGIAPEGCLECLVEYQNYPQSSQSKILKKDESSKASKLVDVSKKLVDSERLKTPKVRSVSHSKLKDDIEHYVSSSLSPKIFENQKTSAIGNDLNSSTDKLLESNTPSNLVNSSNESWKRYFTNLCFLKKWLSKIPMYVTDDNLKAIAIGRDLEAHDLLYSMYVRLEMTGCCPNKRHWGCNENKYLCKIRCDPVTGEKIERRAVKDEGETMANELMPPKKDKKAQIKWVAAYVDQFKTIQNAPRPFIPLIETDSTTCLEWVDRVFEEMKQDDDRRFEEQFARTLAELSSPDEENLVKFLKDQESNAMEHLRLRQEGLRRQCEDGQKLKAEYETFVQHNADEDENTRQLKVALGDDTKEMVDNLIAHTQGRIDCERIAIDLITLALRDVNPNVKVPKVLWSQWMQEFIKGRIS